MPKKVCRGRYNTTGLIEDQYESGSRQRVLKNLRGIRSKREMDRVETLELLRVTEEMTAKYDRFHSFTAADICLIHRNWLGLIYEWAGRYRQVGISKGGFPFAAPAHIPKLMDDFESSILSRYTPCISDDRSEIIYSLAVVHTELLLIHPFREGNGRLARLLAALMGLQAGLPLFDFSGVKGKKREAYFAAVRQGLDRNYEPMEHFFKGIISFSGGTL